MRVCVCYMGHCFIDAVVFSFALCIKPTRTDHFYNTLTHIYFIFKLFRLMIYLGNEKILQINSPWLTNKAIENCNWNRTESKPGEKQMTFHWMLLLRRPPNTRNNKNVCPHTNQGLHSLSTNTLYIEYFIWRQKKKLKKKLDFKFVIVNMCRAAHTCKRNIHGQRQNDIYTYILICSQHTHAHRSRSLSSMALQCTEWDGYSSFQFDGTHTKRFFFLHIFGSSSSFSFIVCGCLCCWIFFSLPIMIPLLLASSITFSSHIVTIVWKCNKFGTIYVAVCFIFFSSISFNRYMFFRFSLFFREREQKRSDTDRNRKCGCKLKSFIEILRCMFVYFDWTKWRFMLWLVSFGNALALIVNERDRERVCRHKERSTIQLEITWQDGKKTLTHTKNWYWLWLAD